MNRLSVINDIITSIQAQSYLEIGVHAGSVFFNVEVPMKYGVDPKFLFSISETLEDKPLFINGKLCFLDANLYELTSDQFFEIYAPDDLKDGIDVVFVDGLHTYEQSLKDVKNCLPYLNDGGVIIMHDCNPLSYATAYPAKKSMDEVLNLAKQGEIPGWNYNWNGDVWKALVHLRVEYDSLNIFTLDLDWGLGIITSGKGDKIENILLKDIQEADYSFLERNRETLLNLKPPKYLYEALENKNLRLLKPST